jgi:hypothetical protein
MSKPSRRTQALLDKLEDRCGTCQACVDRKDGARMALRWALRVLRASKRCPNKDFARLFGEADIREAIKVLEGGEQ